MAESIREALMRDKMRIIKEFVESTGEKDFLFEPTTCELPHSILFDCPILCAAIYYGSIKSFEYLIGAGISITQGDRWNKAPCHFLAEFNRLDMATHEVAAGIDYSTADFMGRLPIHYAAENGNTEFVQFLVQEKGSDPNVADKYGTTPLHLAAKEGHCDTISFLLEHVQPTNDSKGISPAVYATRNGKKQALEIFLQKDPGCALNENGGLLKEAAIYGFADGIEMLLAIPEVDPNALDSYGVCFIFIWHLSTTLLSTTAKNAC